jgi:hypothetical protein
MIITPTVMMNVLYFLDAWSVLVKRNCSIIEKREHSQRMVYALHRDLYYTQHISTQF